MRYSILIPCVVPTSYLPMYEIYYFLIKGKKTEPLGECLINGVETNSYLFGIKIKLDPYTLHHIEKYIYY